MSDREKALEAAIRRVLEPARGGGDIEPWVRDILSDALAMPATERVQHVKRGSTYRVIGRGKVQTDTPLSDYAEVVIYQGEADDLFWVRPVSEFEDGRFAPPEDSP